VVPEHLSISGDALIEKLQAIRRPGLPAHEALFYGPHMAQEVAVLSLQFAYYAIGLAGTLPQAVEQIFVFFRMMAAVGESIDVVQHAGDEAEIRFGLMGGDVVEHTLQRVHHVSRASDALP
jgi:hypothetical protein